MIESLLSAIYYNIDGTNAILDKTHGRSPYDNLDKEYTSVANPLLPPLELNQILEEINTNVNRFASTPDAEKYLEHWFTPIADAAYHTRSRRAIFSRGGIWADCCLGGFL